MSGEGGGMTIVIYISGFLDGQYEPCLEILTQKLDTCEVIGRKIMKRIDWSILGHSTRVAKLTPISSQPHSRIPLLTTNQSIWACKVSS